MLKGKEINPSAAAGIRYYQKLESMIDQMIDETERKIKKLFGHKDFEEYFAMDDSVSAQARILTNYLFRRFNGLFAQNAKRTSERFVNQVNNASSQQVHSAIVELSGGLSLSTQNLDGQLKDMFSATISENVELIKTIPMRYLSNVKGAVMRSIVSGNGLQDLVPYLQRLKKSTYRNAQLMALDQNRKAMQGLSRARMENLGFKEFEWVHTGGGQTQREEHVELNGKIFSFDDPPIIDKKTGERGFPAQLPNCRCKMKMVYRIDGKII